MTEQSTGGEGGAQPGPPGRGGFFTWLAGAAAPPDEVLELAAVLSGAGRTIVYTVVASPAST